MTKSVGSPPYYWDTTKVNDGWYKISLHVVDDFQNESSKDMRVTVDNTPPAINIITPSENERKYWSVIIKSETNDSNLKEVWLFLDGTSKYYEDSTFTYKWNIWSLSSGVHEIRIKVIDRAGNESSMTISIVKVEVTEAIENFVAENFSVILIFSLIIFLFLYTCRAPELNRTKYS